MNAFLTILTPTYRRPRLLAKAMRSIQHQHQVDQVQHLVIPDYIGHGVAGMYATLPDYIGAIHGQYVYLMADDDELASDSVVEDLMRVVQDAGEPPVVIAKCRKGAVEFPHDHQWPPRTGQIDLGCIITRADVWRACCRRYGHRYEGDQDFVHALGRHYTATFSDLLFAHGHILAGAHEAPDGMDRWLGKPRIVTENGEAVMQ